MMYDQRIQHILVIDDDESIQQMVCDKLEYEGYEVWTASDGRQALEIINRRGLPHLAIVDIHMPGMDGFEFCRTVHQYADLPVILLTAIADEETIVRGIKECAEDYVTKPFSPRQLAARVERVLHRMGSFAYALEPKVKIDDFLAVDLAHQEVQVNGGPVKLTPIENKILYILLCNAPRVVTTRFLLDRIWPHESVLEDVLRVHVHRLREKIEGNSGPRRYILTERGLGYRFNKC
jgi:DNA-binding response OmpR family regulator